MKVRKKPVVVDAIQYKEDNHKDVYAFLHPELSRNDIDEIDSTNISGYFFIYTLEGKMKANVGDWIIKGVNGEYYPCKPDIFEKTYEIIEED